MIDRGDFELWLLTGSQSLYRLPRLESEQPGHDSVLHHPALALGGLGALPEDHVADACAHNGDRCPPVP
jgi:hypothetical protein